MIEIEKSQQKAIRISFFIGIVILGFKFAAYLITNSTALLSDALESIINVVASAFAMWSIHLAKAPPDSNHPYGHGKVEYFSALLEGVLIILAALCIIYAALPRILAPGNLNQLDYGLLVSVIASIMNFVLGMYLIRQGKRTNSLTLVADGKHVLTDVYTTVGVLFGLLIVWVTNWLWMDAAIACVVAVNIVWTGYGLVRQAVKGLMNEADTSLSGDICKLLNENRRPEWISIHKLRTWQAGRFVHVDSHLMLPRMLSFEESQVVVNNMETIFKNTFDGVAEVMIRPDICSSKYCNTCSYAACPSSVPSSGLLPWDCETLYADQTR